MVTLEQDRRNVAGYFPVEPDAYAFFQRIFNPLQVELYNKMRGIMSLRQPEQSEIRENFVGLLQSFNGDLQMSDEATPIPTKETASYVYRMFDLLMLECCKLSPKFKEEQKLSWDEAQEAWTLAWSNKDDLLQKLAA